MIRRFSFVLALLLCSGTVFAQQLWSNFLNPVSSTGAVSQLAIVWQGNVGVVGGVPSASWTQHGSTITATGSDQTLQIQTALNGCSTAGNQYVLLAAGTFTIATTVNVPGNCALRGSGADQTIINATGTGQSPITIGCASSCGVSYSGPLSIIAGATAGSNSITLSGLTGVAIGKYLAITELNDPSYVTSAGSEGNCTFCDFDGGARSRGQIVEVEGLPGGNVVTISPALYTSYANTPTAVPFAASAKYAGVENLQVYSNGTNFKDSFYMVQCVNCWVIGSEVNYANGSSTSNNANFIDVQWGLRDEIRDNYFSNSYYHDIGRNDSQIGINFDTTASLVQNNICERTHVCFIHEWGIAGNVIAYNFTTGEFNESLTTFLTGGFSCHGASPQFNLFEGNIGVQFYFDSVWGSCTNATLFRNWALGTGAQCAPTTNGRNSVTSCTGSNLSYAFQASRAIQIGWLNTYDNFIANVSGSDFQNNLPYNGNPTTHVAQLNWASTGAGAARSYDATNYNFTFGYGESSDDGSTNVLHPTWSGCDTGITYGPCHDGQPAATAFLHGNYTNADGNIGWNGSYTHILPPSFYLGPTAPSWWGSLPWPAIGPDVTTGSGPGGHASLTASNAAQHCYFNVMGGSWGGPGGPLPFNAALCYAAAAQPAVAPANKLFARNRRGK